MKINKTKRINKPSTTLGILVLVFSILPIVGCIAKIALLSKENGQFGIIESIYVLICVGLIATGILLMLGKRGSILIYIITFILIIINLLYKSSGDPIRILSGSIISLIILVAIFSKNIRKCLT